MTTGRHRSDLRAHPLDELLIGWSRIREPRGGLYRSRGEAARRLGLMFALSAVVLVVAGGVGFVVFRLLMHLVMT